MTTRLDQAEQTRVRILKAARHLFATRTYEEVNVREIATAADVSPGTVIARFGSKSELLKSLIIENIQGQESLMKAAALKEQSTYDRIIAMGKACLAFQLGHPGLTRAQHANAWVRSEIDDLEINAVLQNSYQIVIDELRGGQVAGEVRRDIDLHLATQMLHDMLLSACRAGVYGDVDIAKTSTEFQARVDLLMRGLLVESTSSRLPIAA